MAEVTIYHKPTCSKSRQGVKFLEEKGIDFEIVKYYDKPFSKNKLKTLLKKMNMIPSDLLRKREKLYKELDFKNKKYTRDQILTLMVENPNLIERPIVEKGGKAVLARPTENIEKLI